MAPPAQCAHVPVGLVLPTLDSVNSCHHHDNKDNLYLTHLERNSVHTCWALLWVLGQKQCLLPRHQACTKTLYTEQLDSGQSGSSPENIAWQLTAGLSALHWLPPSVSYHYEILAVLIQPCLGYVSPWPGGTVGMAVIFMAIRLLS